MTVSLAEDFEGGSLGSSIQTPATIFDSGSKGVFASGGVTGQCGQHAIGGTADTLIAAVSFTPENGTYFVRWAEKLSVHSSSNKVVAQLFNGSGGNLAQVQWQAGGGFRIRNGFSAVDSGTGLPEDSWVRFEWTIDSGAGTQTLDVFHGANIDGTTPDATLSGAYSGGANAGEFRFGLLQSQANITISLDRFALSDVAMPAWIESGGSFSGTGSIGGVGSLTGRGIEPGLLFTESYEGGTDAAQITDLNSVFDIIANDPAYFDNAPTPLDGSLVGRYTAAGVDYVRTKCEFRQSGIDRVFGRAYVYFDALPSAVLRFLTLETSTLADPAGEDVLALRMSGAGNLRVWNGSGFTTDNMAATTFAADQWYRFDFSFDRTVSANGTTTVRIFTGANLHGATPDEELVVTHVAAPANPIAVFNVGINNLVTVDMVVDGIELRSDDYPAPLGGESFSGTGSMGGTASASATGTKAATGTGQAITASTSTSSTGEKVATGTGQAITASTGISSTGLKVGAGTGQAITASTSTSSTGAKTGLGTGSITATSSLTGDGFEVIAGSGFGTIAATGTLTSTGARTSLGSGAISGTGSADSNGQKVAAGVGQTITASTDISSTGAKTATGTGQAIAASTDTSSAGEKVGQGIGQAITATTGISSTGTRVSLGSGAVSAGSSVSSSGAKTGNGNGSITGAGSLSSNGFKVTLLLFSEDFEGDTPGQTIGPSNSIFELVLNDPATFETTPAPVTGSQVGLYDASGNQIRTKHEFSEVTKAYYRLYIYPIAYPSGVMRFLTLETSPSVSPPGEDVMVLRWETSGRLRVFDGSTFELANQTTDPIPLNEWSRFECGWDGEVGAHGQTTFRLFTGSNRHGITPDEELVVTHDGHASNPANTLAIGVLNLVNAAYAVDALAVGTADWIGPIDAATGTGSIGGTGSLTSTGERASLGTGSITATGSLSGDGVQVVENSGTGSITATSSITSTGSRTSSGSGSMSSSTGISSTGLKVAAGTGQELTLTGSTSSSGAKTGIGSAIITATSSLTGDGVQVFADAGTGSITATGSLDATGLKTGAGTGTTTTTGSLTGTGVNSTQVEGGTGSISGVTTISSTGAKKASGVAAVTGSLTGSSQGFTARVGQGQIDGNGIALWQGVKGAAGTATLSGDGSVTGVGLDPRNIGLVIPDPSITFLNTSTSLAYANDVASLDYANEEATLEHL